MNKKKEKIIKAWAIVNKGFRGDSFWRTGDFAEVYKRKWAAKEENRNGLNDDAIVKVEIKIIE